MQALLDLKLLTTFVRAAHAGTLSAAAIQVGRTQSTVTMQIQRLEDALGQSLFHRSGSGVRLTGAGERFLGYAERILRLHDDAVSSFSDQGLRGAITFGCPEDYLIAFFPALLKSFGAIHRDIEIRVVSAPTPELQKLLHARQIDMALVSTPDITPGGDFIRTEQLAWVGSKPTLELHDFNQNTGPQTPIPLALAAANSLDHRSARDAMDGAKLPYQIAYASNSLAGLIAVTRSGLAISVMMQKAVPSDLFILKSPLPPLPKLGLRVITPELNPTPATDAFADHITKMLPFLWGKETGIWGRLPILFSEGVQKGRIDLNRFVALTATNHAKLYGMYPQKGTIAIGSDADLALWDPNKNVTITNDILQQGCDYSPYEGLQVKGWPVHTIVRGKTVVKDGEVTGQKGDGKYLARQKSNLVTSKPV